jgi:AraC-like DNA-binding protein
MSRDTLSDLLRTVQLRGAAFYFVSYAGKWAVENSSGREIASAVMPGCEHVMEYHMLAKGDCWAAVAGEPPVRMAAGDIVLFAQGDGHTMSSAPGIAAERRTPEWVFERKDGMRPLPISVTVTGAVEGKAMPVSEADTVILCGFLGCDLRPFNPLIGALPRVLHLPAERIGSWVAHIVEQAVIESGKRRPGGDAVLERLSEMMFVDAARSYLDGLPEDATGWLAGLRDRFVGRALALLHENPAQAWTVDELARQVGLSRSTLHERFVQYVDQPPMQYLASWRIQVGARLLRDSNRNVAAIALDTGYESEAAFSRAFKRLVGLPPAAWRRSQEKG